MYNWKKINIGPNKIKNCSLCFPVAIENKNTKKCQYMHLDVFVRMKKVSNSLHSTNDANTNEINSLL